MPRREDYELLWDRYQKEGVANKISIERFCVSNGFTYREFEKWYKQIRCNSFVPIQITNVPLDTPGQASSLEHSVIFEESASLKSKHIIKCIHIECT